MRFLSPVNFRVKTTVAVYRIQIEILQFVKMMVPPLYASPPAPWQEFKPGICRHIIDIMSNTTLAFWPVPSAANTPTPSLYYSLPHPLRRPVQLLSLPSLFYLTFCLTVNFCFLKRRHIPCLSFGDYPSTWQNPHTWFRYIHKCSSWKFVI